MNFFFYFVLLHLLVLSSIGACYQIVSSNEQIPSHLQRYISLSGSSLTIQPGAPDLELLANGDTLDFKVIVDALCQTYVFDFLNGRCKIHIGLNQPALVNGFKLGAVLVSDEVMFMIKNGQVSFESLATPCYVKTDGVFKLKATLGCSATVSGVSLVLPSASTLNPGPTSATASSTLSSTVTATSNLSLVSGSSTTTSSMTSSAFTFHALTSAQFSSSSAANSERTPSVAESGLSKGVMAAIIVGVGLCVIIPIICGLVYYFIIRKKCRKSTKPNAKPKTRSIVKTAVANHGSRKTKSIDDTGLVSTVASKVGNKKSKTRNVPSRFMVNLTGYGNTLLPDNPNEAIELIILKVLSLCVLRSDAQKYDVFEGKPYQNDGEFAAAILDECRPLFIEYLNTRYELQNHEVDEGTILTIVESLVTPEAVKKGIADARQSAFGYEMLGPIVEGLPSKVATAKPKEGPYLNMSEIRNNGQVFPAITGRKRRTAE